MPFISGCPRRALAGLSIALNMATGGKRETLCARMARNHGTDCTFCRLVALLMCEPDHCSRQFDR